MWYVLKVKRARLFELLCPFQYCTQIRMPVLFSVVSSLQGAPPPGIVEYIVNATNIISKFQSLFQIMKALKEHIIMKV